MEIKKTIKALSAQKRTLLGGYIVLAVLYLLCVVLFFVDKLYALILFNTATILYLLVIRRMDNRYNIALQKANLQYSWQEKLFCVETVSANGLLFEHAKNVAFIPVAEKGGIRSTLGVTGQIQGTDVSMHDISAYYPLFKPVGKKKIAILSGLWVELTLPQSFAGDFVLTSKAVIDNTTLQHFYASQGLAEVPILNQNWKERYMLFTKPETLPKDANRFVKQCDALVTAAEKNGKEIVVRLYKNKLMAFINKQSFTFQTPLKSKVTAELLAWNQLPEFNLLYNLAVYYQKVSAEST